MALVVLVALMAPLAIVVVEEPVVAAALVAAQNAYGTNRMARVFVWT